MDKISSIRGMPDVFESDTNYLAELNETLSRIFLSNNLNEVNTPILEQTELFVRSTGCLLYTSPSPRDVEESRMPSSA